jgi:uncharacterized membrane protein HdeD (DUF308 family)
MAIDNRKVADELWWLLVVAGIVSILFGLATLFMPGLTFETLVMLFAAFLLIHGVIEMLRGLVTIGKNGSWWASILIGFLQLGAGVYLVKNPILTTIVYLALTGWVLIFRGIFEGVFGLFLSKEKMHWLISAVLSILAGIIIWKYPIRSGLAFTWVLGLYALMNGTLLISSSFEAKRVIKKATSVK